MKTPIRALMMGVAALIFIAADVRGAAPAKDEVSAVIEFENVPLPEVIRSLARQARINIVMDPKLLEPPFNRPMVSVRWERVTAREALLAVLENYDLILVEK